MVRRRTRLHARLPKPGAPPWYGRGPNLGRRRSGDGRPSRLRGKLDCGAAGDAQRRECEPASASLSKKQTEIAGKVAALLH